MSHGTASTYEIPQFLVVSNAVATALPKALDGIDPKSAIRSVTNNGHALELHLRKFFEPEQPTVLRPRFIIRLSQVPVNYDRDWNGSIDAAGPNPGKDFDIRKVGGLYVAERKGIVSTDITLVNFAEGVSSEQIIELGQQWKLGRVINPQECFAISEHFPKLHTGPGFFDQMAVVALKECVFRGRRRVCCVWFRGQQRECRLAWFDDGWRSPGWFGFVSES